MFDDIFLCSPTAKIKSPNAFKFVREKFVLFSKAYQCLYT